jgi:hypothetical protein
MEGHSATPMLIVILPPGNSSIATRAVQRAFCLITYQSGPLRMEARLREIRREGEGEAESDAQQKCFTCPHTSESIPQ